MKKGITLVELLIAMTTMAILLTAFSAIFANSVKTMRRELAQTQIQTETQTLLDRIQQDIKKGRTTEGSYTHSGTTYTTGANSVILLVPSIDNSANSNIIYDGSNPLLDRVIYYKNGQNLYRVVYANIQSSRMNEHAQIKHLSSNISELSFTYTKVNPTSNVVMEIDTRLSIVKKVGNENRSTTVTGKASFRNLP